MYEYFIRTNIYRNRSELFLQYKKNLMYQTGAFNHIGLPPKMNHIRCHILGQPKYSTRAIILKMSSDINWDVFKVFCCSLSSASFSWKYSLPLEVSLFVLTWTLRTVNRLYLSNVNLAQRISLKDLEKEFCFPFNHY